MIAIASLFCVLAAAAASAAADEKAGTAEARALAAATDASLARGDYETAIRQARSAFERHEALGARADAAWDLNAIGLANQYLGRYGPALAAYHGALALDRAALALDGEITRLNNIGNVHFLLGRYSDAQAAYQEAAGKLGALSEPAAQARLRKMTVSNLAALDQRLGAYERALDSYAQLSSPAMQPAEEAQLLVNQGALARRLGDPVKALDRYRAAQRLFAGAAHQDGEIGAWRNIGIVYALDLADQGRALGAFDTALRLARSSANRRGETQALLYRGEVLRRGGRGEEARRDLVAALEGAVTTGLVEDQWKALHGLALVAQERGDRTAARAALERAIAAIESVRADLRTLALRSEFLADKRDVYDALIGLRLAEEPAPVDELFRLLEQSRARTFRDRFGPDTGPPPLSAIQAALPADALLLEYWVGNPGAALLWLTREAAGVVRRTTRPSDAETIARLSDAVARKDSDWRPASVAAGELLLANLPPLSSVRHLLIVPDGPLHFVPFETLTLPAESALVVERFDVSYLPSAALLLHAPAARSGWAWPWQRDLVAFGDPAPAGSYPLETAAWPRLPYAAEEVRKVARALPGRTEMHLGADARKEFVTGDRLRGAPVVHFSTHAVADTRDPDRSRILLAPRTPGGAADYLFLRDASDLDLSAVGLVTLAACETERGKVVRGEGVEGFSRALLAAGAAAVVTTRWEVADRPGAEFMAQFYASAGRGRSTAGALREAKLAFLRSPLAWSHPYYWAGYLLSGNGARPLPRVVPWSGVVASALVTLALFSAALRAAAKGRRSRTSRRTAGRSH